MPGGDPNSSINVLTIIAATIRDYSFWTGLLTVFAFALGRFNERYIDEKNIDPPLPARYFTSRYRYYSAACIFSSAYVFFYVFLIVLFSFQFLQVVWISLFPSVPDSTIGTPAWAAMVLTVVAPTVPVVVRVESAIRSWLQEFSDTPYKARDLAEEFVDTLLKSDRTSTRIEDASVPTLVAVFDELEGLQTYLTTGGHRIAGQRYKTFFAENSDVLNSTIEQFRRIQHEIAGSSNKTKRSAGKQGVETPPVYRTQLVNLLRRFGRLLACALLYVEAEEYAARERLRKAPKFSDFARASFHFTAAQVILGVILITFVATVSGAVCDPILTLLRGYAVTPSDLVSAWTHWGAWGAMMGIAFSLPLFLVAATRLYLIDHAANGGKEIGGQDKVLMLVLVFVGCFGLSVLPIIIIRGYQAGAEFDVYNLTISLFWAIPPAIVSTAFVTLSGVHRKQSRLRDRTLDFSVFAAIGGISGIVVAAFVTLIDVSTYGKSGTFTLFGTLLYGNISTMVTVTAVSGAYGALQCSASRVMEIGKPVVSHLN